MSRTCTLSYINRQSAATAQPRHMKSVKIGIGLCVVFLLSFSPALHTMTGGGFLNGYYDFAFSINNLANFFIYLVVDEEFRVKLKAMCKRSRE